MAFKLLTRGGIYLLFVVGVLAQWLFKKNAEKKPKQAIDDNIVLVDPVTSLSNQDWHIRLAAIRKLAENPLAENIPRLIERLSDDVYNVREAACFALIAHGNNAIIATIEVLETGELEAREMAVQVLESLPTEISLAALGRALLQDESAWVRIPIAQALGNIGDKSTVPSLVAALEDNHQDVYSAVVVALNQIGTLEAIQAISDNPYQDKDDKKTGKKYRGDDLLELS